ncbi:Cobalamin (vitamin B12) biosynthesis CbiG, core domain protein [Candidatus Magnetoovum chiemensis]|nr:Cobalamin (vitamin B12) biosynthesis CbiG, core domain protein [Candidatus Magnetoovum chiemensis]
MLLPSIITSTCLPDPSEVVEKHLGVKSVCEAAAILASQNGNLIIPKIKRGNATIAAARKIVKSKK